VEAQDEQRDREEDRQGRDGLEQALHAGDGRAAGADA
jgi:hypothetical protein